MNDKHVYTTIPNLTREKAKLEKRLIFLGGLQWFKSLTSIYEAIGDMTHNIWEPVYVKSLFPGIRTLTATILVHDPAKMSMLGIRPRPVDQPPPLPPPPLRLNLSV